MADTGEPPPHRHQPGKVKFLVCVDDSEDCRVARRFASLRARNTGGHVVLLYVIEPADFQHWAAVGRLMEDEPVLIVREGRRGEEILKLIEEDPTIDIMVLGAAAEGHGSNELVRLLTGELTKRLRIPLTIVPGNLTDEQLESLT